MNHSTPAGTIFAKPPKSKPAAPAPKLDPERRALLVERIAERAVARWLVMGVEGAKATASEAMTRKMREIAEDAVGMAERCYSGEDMGE